MLDEKKSNMDGGTNIEKKKRKIFK